MSSSSIFTIGYGSRTIEQLIQLLKQYQIAYLIDVRSKPYSKHNPEFSKRELQNNIEQANIRYVFMGDLLGGQPSVPSCYTKDGKIDYSKVREKDFYKRGIERLRNAWNQRLSVVILCSEQKPEMCHRSKLIGMSLTEARIPVEHIDENGKLVSQKDVMLRLSNGQHPLFEESDRRYTSRKKYGSKGENNEK